MPKSENIYEELSLGKIYIVRSVKQAMCLPIREDIVAGSVVSVSLSLRIHG